MGLAGLITLTAGCSQPAPLKWTEQEVIEVSGRADLPKLFGRKFSDSAWVLDIDGDNKADALLYAQCIVRYDKDKEKELRAKYSFEFDAKEMTPTLKELATRVMHAQRDFTRRYLVESDAYVRHR